MKFKDTKIELALLNACVFNNALIQQAAAIVTPECFSAAATRRIFEHLLLQDKAGAQIDYDLLRAQLPDIAPQIIDSMMLENVYISVPSYAKSLRSLWIKSQVFAAASAAASEIGAAADEVEFTHELSARLYKILSGVSDSELKNAGVVINEFYAHFAKMCAMLDKSIVGVSSGFFNINYYTKGFKDGELVVLAARPGMGKTTLALNLALKALEQDVGVVYYSLEMPAAQLMSKLLAISTQLPMQDILMGNLDDEQILRMQDSAQQLAARKFFVYDKGFLTIETLRASLRRCKEENPEVKLAVLDYLGLMNFTGSAAERYNQISEISRQLKLLALELQMPILVLSQLNREVEKRADKVPVMSDIRDSGSVEQDADMIFFIHPLTNANAEYLRAKGVEVEALERPCVLNLAKNRSGQTGDMFFDFLASRSTFSAIEFAKSNAPVSTTVVG